MMNTEFNGRPEAAEHAEAMFLQSLDELLPDLRARGHPARARAAPRRLHRGRARRGRHGPRPEPRLDRLPLLHAAHVPPGQRPGRDHRPRRRPGDQRAPRRRPRPHRLERPALHLQPARSTRARAPARGDGRGRGRLRRRLRRAGRGRASTAVTHCVFGWEERATRDRRRATAPPSPTSSPSTSARTPVLGARHPEGRPHDRDTSTTGPPARSSKSATDRFGDVTDPATGEVTGQVALATEADVEQVVAAAAAAFPGWRDTSLARRTPDPVPRSASCSTPAPASSPRSSPPSTARCSPTPPVRSPAARRSSSSPAACRTCSRARPPRTPRPASTCSRSASRSASSGSSARSTSRRWCRCGSSRSRSPPATPWCSSRRRRCRRRRCGWPSCGARPGCPTGCSTC